MPSNLTLLYIINERFLNVPCATKNSYLFPRYLVTVKSEHTGGPTGGNTALVQLSPWDTVVVKTATGVVNKLYGNSTELVCIFSGYLVN